MINRMEEDLRTQHVNRLQSGEYSPQAGIVFIDIVNNLEQIGNHACNIANTILSEQKDYQEIQFLQPQ